MSEARDRPARPLPARRGLSRGSGVFGMTDTDDARWHADVSKGELRRVVQHLDEAADRLSRATDILREDDAE